MNMGMQLVFQKHDDFNDREMYRHEVELTVEAEAMSFDTVWPVEHHFTDYSMCPDNMQFLSYVAGRTTRLGLATGAIIVPWNDPMRVVEKMVLLDHLSDGRAILGLGRGLARREYRGMRQDMDEARERFNEGAEIILRGLEEGFVEANGKYYQQPRIEVRPRPIGSFRDRRYMVCMSPDSFEVAAELGMGVMMFSQFPYEQLKDRIDHYRQDYRAKHAEEPPPINCADFVACFPERSKAEEIARKHIVGYLASVLDHYEMLDAKHFEKTGRSYQHYADSAKMLEEMGHDAMMDGFLEANLWGDPAQIRDRLEKRRELIGDFEVNGVFSYQSLPFDMVAQNMTLFVDEVGPTLKGWPRGA